MKKILLLLFFIFNSVFSFSAMKDKLGIEYMFICYECDKMLKEECSTHKNSCIQYYVLESTKTLLNEFNKNEPRALHNYHSETKAFIMKGVVRELSSGLLDDEFIINLKDGTMVYIYKDQQDKYFELNAGDEVYLCANLPSKVLFSLNFKNGVIMDKGKYEELISAIKEL